MHSYYCIYISLLPDYVASLAFCHPGSAGEITVNSKIFARTLFSRNFAYAKFREIKPSRNGKITVSLIDIGKSCPNREFFTSLMCLLMKFAKTKISRKFPNLQYYPYNRVWRVGVMNGREGGLWWV